MHNFGRAVVSLGITLSTILACGESTEGTDTLDDSARVGAADSGSGTSTGDGGTKPGTGDAATGSDAATDAPTIPTRPTGPGEPPTRTATINANAQGFFELQTAASGLSYTARLPAGYVTGTPYPLVVGLHGCGDSAAHFATWAVVPWASLDTQPYLAVSVGGRDGGCWDLGQDEAKVLEVVDDVRQMFFVHQKKVTLAGYSSGGMLAYYTGLRNAYRFAGILIENSGMPFGDQTDAVLAAAEWKLNVAASVHIQDGNFTIGSTRGDRDRLLGAGFPVQYRELDGGHDGDSIDWTDFLLPKIAGFEAP